jgi:hypothetical protein
MRTKVLLCAAALAASLASSMADGVYSVNVVGYVNVTLTSGKLHFLSLPVAPTDGNYNITNTIVLSDPQDSAILYNWADTQWNPDPPVWYAGAGWFNSGGTDTIVSNGTAFFISSKADSVLTFVGEVPQGAAIPYNIPVGLSTLANKVPVTGSFPGSTVGNEGDRMFTWIQSGAGGQAWTSDAYVYYGGSGWYTSSGGDGKVRRSLRRKACSMLTVGPPSRSRRASLFNNEPLD